jgi:hypothetical protein
MAVKKTASRHRWRRLRQDEHARASRRASDHQRRGSAPGSADDLSAASRCGDDPARRNLTSATSAGRTQWTRPEEQGRSEAAAARRRTIERHAVRRQWLQSPPKALELGVVDPGADAAGIKTDEF